jgi:SAM-dependent methyltransferase
MGLTCPLCQSPRIFKVRGFSIPYLRQEWINSFGFDPYPATETASRMTLQRCALCNYEFFDPQFIGDAAFYERMCKNPWYYEDDKWEFEEAIRRLSGRPEHKSLLEIGCGRGSFLEKVAGCYDAWGTEINAEALRICGQKGLNAADKSVKELGRNFDVIVSFEVLEHLPDPRSFLCEVNQALTPGGTLIFAVPNPEGYLGQLDHVLLDMPPHHAGRWNSATWDYVAQTWGLRLIGRAFEPLRYPHYLVYMDALSAEHQRWAHVPPVKTRLERWRQMIAKRLGAVIAGGIAPILLQVNYPYCKQNLVGQTQFVEFQKPRG